MISLADFQKITTLIFDIDGTLTNGQAAYLSSGDVVKFFNHHDMHWLKMAVRAGLRVGTISASDDPANRRVPEMLGLDFAVCNAKDKLAAFENILTEFHLSASECLYMGDDIVDMPVLRRVGIGVAVADAVPELDEVVKWRTCSPGGKGAAREVVTRILKAKGLFDTIMERYRR